jgi:hypothetical protein
VMAGIADAHDVFTPELDAATEVNVTCVDKSTLRVQYVVKDPEVQDIVLHVKVYGTPITGSPFKLHASN